MFLWKRIGERVMNFRKKNVYFSWGAFQALCLSFLLLFQTAEGATAVQVTAQADRSRMSLGDSFTYSIRVASTESVEIREPRLPDITGLELINSWQSSETRSSYSGGQFQVEQVRSFNYLFITQREGAVSVGSAEVVVNGQSYRTPTVTVQVGPQRPGSSPPRPPSPPAQAQPRQDPFADAFREMEELLGQFMRPPGGSGFRSQPINPDEAFFIQVEVDKTEAYVGEQVTASWYLYTRGHIREIDTLEYPSVHGFWKEDIEMATRLNFEQKVVNGVPYRRALLATYALFPMSEGVFEVDSYKARCTVVMPGDFGLGRPYQYTKASQPVPIRVKALPTEGRPRDFSGAVGEFELEAQLDRQQVKVNEPVVLTIRVAGRGNAKLIDLPPLDLPGHLELYDSKHDSEFFRDGRSFKVFELLLIPRQAGEWTLPEITMSAFHPERSEYYSFGSSALQLTVEGSQEGGSDQAVTKSFIDGGGAGSWGRELRPPELLLQWRATSIGAEPGRLWVWAGVYLGVFALLVWRSRVEWAWRRRKKNLKKIVLLRMQMAKDLVARGQWRGAAVKMSNLLDQILGEVCGQGGASQEISRVLTKGPPSLRREMGEALVHLSEQLATLSFAPEKVVGELKNADALNAILEKTESTLLRVLELTEAENELESA